MLIFHIYYYSSNTSFTVRTKQSIRIIDDDDGDDLEALSVDDGWSRLVVLFLRDPHLLEGR